MREMQTRKRRERREESGERGEGRRLLLADATATVAAADVLVNYFRENHTLFAQFRTQFQRKQ